MAQDVDLFDIGLVHHKARHGFHLHGRVGVKTEVPVAALAVGQVRVHRRVVEVEHLFAGVAFVVLGHRIGQGQGDGGAIALDDVARALVDCGFERVQAFGGAELVVHADHFELDAGRVALAAVFFGEKLVALELAHAHGAEQAGQGIDTNHLDGFTLLGEGASGAQNEHRSGGKFQRK